jgi:hypothetical protein
MLSSHMFVYTEPRSAKLQFGRFPSSPRRCLPRPNPQAALGASTPVTRQIVCKLVTLCTPTDAFIPFVFNQPSAVRLRRAPTGCHVSPLFSFPCRRFPSQQGGTLLYPERLLRRVIVCPEPAAAGRPVVHLSSFSSNAYGLFVHNGAPQPFSLQSFADSFHRHGGVYPPSILYSLSAHNRASRTPLPLLSAGSILKVAHP